MYHIFKRKRKLAEEEQIQYLASIKTAQPANFKVAYAFAAIPARYVLENKQWKAASVLQLQKANFSWLTFPWQEAMSTFYQNIRRCTHSKYHWKQRRAGKTEPA